MEKIMMSAREAGGKNLCLHVASELMKNQVMGSALSLSHAMASASDLAGEPILFSIGNDDVLYGFMRSVTARSGWVRHDLTSCIEPHEKLAAVSFGSTQMPDGRIVLAVALAPRNDRSKARLFVTTPIPNDAILGDWSSLGSRWKARPFPDGGVAISEVRLGGATESTPPIGVASIQGPAGIEPHLFNADASDDVWSWQRFELPERATGPVVLAPGAVQGDRGAYALYDTSAGQTLEFTSIPDPVFHKSSKYEFVLPARANWITALSSSTNSSDLYAAGDGIYAFLGSHANAVTLVPKHRLSGIYEAVVTQDPSVVSVFALAGDGLLFHCYGQKADQSSWEPPLQIQRGVTRIAAARSTSKATNQLFVARGTSQLSYLYQDPSSTLWSETEIRLADTHKSVELTTYTTTAHAADADGKPLPNHRVSIWSSMWTHVTINGAMHGISQDQPISVLTDLAGTLTIVSEATDISAVTLHLQLEGADEVINVYPAHGVLRRIEAVEDYASEKLHDGSPLLDKSHDVATRHAVKDGVKAMLQSAEPSARLAAASRHVATGLRGPAFLASGTGNDVFSMTFVAGVTTFHSSAHLSNSSSLLSTALDPLDWDKGLRVLAGNALQWMNERIDDIGRILWRQVKDGFEFLIELGKEAFRFIVSGVEATLKAVSWVLKKGLGIDLEKIWSWLGFVFDWKAILRMQALLVRLAGKTFEHGRTKIHGAEETVSAFFLDLKSKAKKLASVKHSSDSQASVLKRYQASAPSASVDQSRSIQLSPGNSWGQYHLLHSGAEDNSSPKAPKPTTAVQAFMQDVAGPVLASIETTVHQLGEDFKSVLDGETTSVDEFIAKLASDAALGLLDVAEKLVVGLLHLLEDIISLIQSAMTEAIDVPFFSAFFKEHVGRNLSLLDVVMLVMAVFASAGYRAATGRPALPAEPTLFETGDADQIFAALSGRQPARSNTSALPASVNLVAGGTLNAGLNDPIPMSDALKGYSQWGGLIYSASSFIGDCFGVAGTWASMVAVDCDVIAEMEKQERRSLTCDLFRFGLSVPKVAMSFPVGDSPQVHLQRGIWYTSGILALLDPALVWYYRGTNTMTLSKLRGTLMIAGAFTTYVIESIVFYDYELKQVENHDLNINAVDVVLKYLQNNAYFAGDVANGIGCILPGGPPASQPAMVKQGFLLGSLAPSGVAGTFNGLRAFINMVGNVAHLNF